MEELDKILVSRKVNLGEGYASSDDKSESGLSLKSAASDGSGYLRREMFTESMIRNDAFAPHVVHFTHTWRWKASNGGYDCVRSGGIGTRHR